MTGFYELPAEERISLTRSAVANRIPLMVLWAALNPDITDSWSWRAKIAAEWLADAKSVVDLGCGNMELEKYLRRDQKYIPIDIVPRDERTIVLDLNKDDLPQVAADGCALLGVLEYMLDLSGFLTKLRARFPRVVTSFVHREDGDTEDSRLAMGWINHLDQPSIRRAFEEAGYSIERDAVVADRQHVYDPARRDGGCDWLVSGRVGVLPDKARPASQGSLHSGTSETPAAAS